MLQVGDTSEPPFQGINGDYYDSDTGEHLTQARANLRASRPPGSGRPLTLVEARTLVAQYPNLFFDHNGHATVDFAQTDGVIRDQLYATHVGIIPGAGGRFANCIDWAVGGKKVLVNSLATLTDICRRNGLTPLTAGDSNATADLWGANDDVRHGTRQVNGNLWGSVMGMGSEQFLVHSRLALAGSSYGAVIGSFQGPRMNDTAE